MCHYRLQECTSGDAETPNRTHRRTCFVHVWTTGVLQHKLVRQNVTTGVLVHEAKVQDKQSQYKTEAQRTGVLRHKVFRQHATTGVVMLQFEQQEQHYQMYRSAC